jgi:TetR/AcrR family transcriptional regulator, copper-responsive repressor
MGMLAGERQEDYLSNAMKSERTAAAPLRGRPRSFDREAALDAAMRVFWARGYEAASISDLSTAMGINPPSLYAAFGDKRGLFDEAVTRYQASHGGFAAAALLSAATARDAIEAILLQAARSFSDPATPPGCMVVLAATNCTPDSEDVAAALRERRQASERCIRERIIRGVEAGELGSDDAEGLASFYVAVFQGMSLKARDGASRAELEAIARQAMRAWPVSPRAGAGAGSAPPATGPAAG